MILIIFTTVFLKNMQFKHPEVLYFMALLAIPIIVHLFHLQRFVKTPFTNVAFLQKLVIQTRKSSRIKKWLLLTTRMLLFTFIILAFAQPYFSDKKTNELPHYAIYLDNSLSTNSQGEKGDLLQTAAHELIDNLSKEASYTLQTNDIFIKDKSEAELKEVLLQVKNTSKKKSIRDVLLKIATENTKQPANTKNIIISDFQNVSIEDIKDIKHPTSFIQLTPELEDNLSIDSITIQESGIESFDIQFFVKNQGPAKNNVPVSLHNNEKLINKQTFSIEENTTKAIRFTIIKPSLFLGKIMLNFNDSFSFDNSFYFVFSTQEKINVMAIEETSSFLARIYTKDEFNFKQTSVQNINYNDIPKQHLILINDIKTLPKTLISSLIDFIKKGGNIAMIPNAKSDLNTYNSFFQKLALEKIDGVREDSLKISEIHFNHPVFKGVFEKKIRNFQYPSVRSFYATPFKKATSMLSFEDKTPFVSEIKLDKGTVFWVASSLDKKNSNFINSPLVVPVFYQMGKQSLQLSKLYYTIGRKNFIDIKTTTGQREVFSIQNHTSSFIPLQQLYQNKIRITTEDTPKKAGFSFITQEKDTLKPLAFNYSNKESLLQYLDLEKLINKEENVEISSSVEETFKAIHKKNEVQWLWKWFLILSIVSLLLEIFILKFFKS